MVVTILATALFVPIVRLEAQLPKATYQRGEKIRIEIYAVNDSNREAVIGRSAIGNYGSGSMDGKVTFVGENKPELDHYNPNRGQIMSGDTLLVREDDFAVIPPRSRTLVFFEEISGEWKDGYTPWNAPGGIKAVSIPARPGEYKFAYTYTFNRKKAQEGLKGAAKSFWRNESSRPIVFEGQARKRFDAAVEGKWTATGSFRIAS